MMTQVEQTWTSWNDPITFTKTIGGGSNRKDPKKAGIPAKVSHEPAKRENCSVVAECERTAKMPMRRFEEVQEAEAIPAGCWGTFYWWRCGGGGCGGGRWRGHGRRSTEPARGDDRRIRMVLTVLRTGVAAARRRAPHSKRITGRQRQLWTGEYRSTCCLMTAKSWLDISFTRLRLPIHSATNLNEWTANLTNGSNRSTRFYRPLCASSSNHFQVDLRT